MPSGGGSTTTTTTKELSPQQQRLLTPTIKASREFMRTPLELFPESTIAGATDTQQAARQMISDTAQGSVQDLADTGVAAATQGQQLGFGAGAAGLGQLFNAGQQANQTGSQLSQEFNNTQGTRDFLSSGALLDPATNPILGAQTEAAIDPIFDRLNREVLPRIDNNFATSNMFGSSRQGIAQGMAIDEALGEAGDVATRLQANNFNQGLGAMLDTAGGARDAAAGQAAAGLGAAGTGTGQAFNMALQSMINSPAMAQLAFIPGTTMEGVGRVQQQEEQAQLTEQANRFMTEQMMPFLQARDVANMALGIGTESTVANANQPSQSPLGGILGALSAIPFLF